MNADNHINLNNYESWLLLYVDNELSPQQKQAVTSFAAKHPHVQQELEALLQTVQEPEEFVVFGHKEDLLKNTDNEWSDEQLLLYLDNELAAEEAARIVSTKDEAVIKRLEILKSTYLQPDETIVFAGKKQLYKSGRVISSVNWLPGFAAAAIVTLVIGSWLYFWKQEKDNLPQSSLSQLTDTTKNTPAVPQEPVSDVPDEPQPQHTGKKTATTHTSGKSENVPALSLKKEVQELKEVQPVRKVTVEELSIIAAQPAAVPAFKEVLKEKTITIDKQTAVTAGATVQTNAEPKKNTFLKRLSGKVKERAIDILSDDGENINLAGFAININK